MTWKFEVGRRVQHVETQNIGTVIERNGMNSLEMYRVRWTQYPNGKPMNRKSWHKANHLKTHTYGLENR